MPALQIEMQASSTLNFRYFTCLLDKGHIIVNTTPLIALCHIGMLEILKNIYGEVLIPQAVYRELSEKKEFICKKQVDEEI